MKARIKSTGEWVELTEEVTYKMPERMECKETINGRIIPIYDLEFEQPIDWEQRRYEIAKDVYLYRIANSDLPDEWNAKRALETADELIKLLKKQDNENDNVQR